MRGLRSFFALAIAVCIAMPSMAADDPGARISALVAEAKYDEALAVANEFEKLSQAENGGYTPRHAVAVSWIAFLKSVGGNRQAATPYYELAVAIYSKMLPPDHPDLATSLNNLGFNRAETGHGEEAESLYRRALDIRERVLPPNDPAIADTLNNLAELYKSEERIDEVVPLLNRALEIRTRSLPPDDPRIAASLQNLAGALELDPKGDKFVASQKLLEKALTIRLKSQRPDHPEVAGVISKLATNLFNQNKFREAEAQFREALSLRRKSQPANHPDIAATLTGLGLDHLELKNYSEAEAEFREALSIRQQVLAPKSSSIAQSLAFLARTLDDEGRSSEALDNMRRGTAIVLEGGEITLKDKEQLYDHLELISRSRATDLAAARTLLAEAFGLGQHVEQSEAASAVAKMAARFATDDLALQDLVRERDELDAKLNSLERKFTDDLSRPREKRDPNTRTEMDALDQRRVAIDARLKKDFPLYFNLVRPEPLSVEAVSGLLNPDEALISIVSGPNETYVWAVTREGAAWHRVAVSRDWLASSVTSLRPSLDTEDLKKNISNEGSLFDLGLSYDIYSKLLEPLEGTFKDKAHLLIVPSGPLTSLPFQVLVTKRPSILHPKLEQLPAYGDADWLIRHYALSVLPSVTSLKALRQLARQTTPLRPLIGFGNPKLNKRISSNATHIAPMRVAEAETRGAASNSRAVFDTQGIFDKLDELPGTEQELRTVAKELGASEGDLELGADATETKVKETNLAQYNVVYFATHGLVADDLKNTLDEPALVLTPPEKPSALDDGLLTASEISEDLKLNADWVVLAACNTAAPDSKPGAEALSGLAKAFFHAGARALLVSHWRVDSEAAARLTTRTFEIKSKNKSLGRAEALREAMLAQINKKPVVAADLWDAYPAFWAPFSVIGEGGQ